MAREEERSSPSSFSSIPASEPQSILPASASECISKSGLEMLASPSFTSSFSSTTVDSCKIRVMDASYSRRCRKCSGRTCKNQVSIRRPFKHSVSSVTTTSSANAVSSTPNPNAETSTIPAFWSSSSAILSTVVTLPAFGAASSAAKNTTTLPSHVHDNPNKPVTDAPSPHVEEQPDLDRHGEKVIEKEAESDTIVSQLVSYCGRVTSLQMGQPVSAEITQEKEKETTNSTTATGSCRARSLKGISQNPHFRPLERYSGLARKNLISGWDQTYEETVNRIQSLRPDNFWANVDELWKTVEELEGMGYTVAQMKKRLDELTDVMTKSKSCRSKISNLKTRMEGHTKEKKRLENEICKMRAQVEQVTINELIGQMAKLELNLPVFDGLFASLAMAPM